MLVYVIVYLLVACISSVVVVRFVQRNQVVNSETDNELILAWSIYTVAFPVVFVGVIVIFIHEMMTKVLRVK